MAIPTSLLLLLLRACASLTSASRSVDSRECKIRAHVGSGGGEGGVALIWVAQFGVDRERKPPSGTMLYVQ